MDLIENPQTNEVFLDAAQFGIIYAFDGAVYGKDEYQATWRKVNHTDVPSLATWTQDPGKYSSCHHVKGRLTDKDGYHFTVGGSFLYIVCWAEYYDVKVTLLGCYSSRNRARTGVDVQW